MTTKERLNRRDFIKITAVAGGALVGGKLLLNLFEEQQFITLKESRVLMGTIINLAVVANSKPDAEHAIEVTFAELERQIGIFDHRSPGSPVARLNQNGELTNPPGELVEVLEQAIAISKMTDGAFDITVKPLIDLYRQAQPRLPGETEIHTALALVDYTKLSVSGERINFTHSGMAVTLDAIAKGYIIDAGVGMLNTLGFEKVFVEAGGDLMAAGTKDSDLPWKVGLQAPRAEMVRQITTINVENKAVATSGDYMQAYTPDFLNHHIIDPRIGSSSVELASVSVIAPKVVLADGFATAVMVMGTKGLQLIETLPDCEAFAISKDLVVFKTSGFQEY
jgi:thiamine biosynthesis lipoprotein